MENQRPSSITASEKDHVAGDGITERGIDCLIIQEWSQTEATNSDNTERTQQIFENEWTRLFDTVTPGGKMLNNLRFMALTGALRTSRFRSLCWLVFLGVLPSETVQWTERLTVTRARFKDIDCNANQDPRNRNIWDHPLAISESSVWFKFFSARETRKLIARDVDRTLPTVSYFRLQTVQKMMINILHCYTSVANVQYSQGMHEILGPILYVLHQDRTTLKQIRQQGSISRDLETVLSSVLDTESLEADAFTLFECIMKIVHPWYFPTEHTLGTMRKENSLFKEPGKKHSNANNPGMELLNWIFHDLLFHSDHDLYKHLKRMEIAPASFGLRWIRLLFGHEFPLNELLFIWDCIFAIGNEFALVPYIAISMLNYLSPSLMTSGFSDCLALLMRFPTEVKCGRLVRSALSYYDSNTYPILPDPYVFEMNESERRILSRKRLSANGFIRPKVLRTNTRKHDTMPRSQSVLRRKSSLLDLTMHTNIPLNFATGQLGKGIADGIRLAFSGRSTPSMGRSPSITRKLTRQDSVESRTEMETPEVSETVDYCAQRLEMCSAHLDLVLCQLIRESDQVDFGRGPMLNELPDLSEKLTHCERLRLIRIELKQLQALLLEMTSPRYEPSVSSMEGSNVP